MTRRNATAMLQVEWPAPPGVFAITTTRQGGVSSPPYASLNLATHVGDDAACVAENRRRLHETLSLPSHPFWLEQVHSCDVVRASSSTITPRADACYTHAPGVVCAVLTADCLPVLLCDRQGQHLAAVHAGWRGLAAGIVEAAVRALPVPATQLLAWLGPAIGPTAFEVGDEVRAAFIQWEAAARAAFVRNPVGGWYADLYALARQRLNSVGVDAVYGGEWCTYNDADRFFSYRRDQHTGRMATLIWRK